MLNDLIDMLNKEATRDPFETAAKKALYKQLSEEEKAVVRLDINRRIQRYYKIKKEREILKAIDKWLTD